MIIRVPLIEGYPYQYPQRRYCWRSKNFVEILRHNFLSGCQKLGTQMSCIFCNMYSEIDPQYSDTMNYITASLKSLIKKVF